MGLFSKPEQHQFNVTGMTCGGCEGKVKNALSGLKGVKSVEASASDNLVTVMAKGVDSSVLVNTITGVGFKVN